MKDSMHKKLSGLKARSLELESLLSDGQVIAEQNRFRALSKEYADLEEVVKIFDAHSSASADLKEVSEMEKDADPEIRAMAEDEIARCKARLADLESALHRLLLPKDEQDACNVFLEIRAGTGGDEAAIFAGDLYRMYYRYCERQGWKMEVITSRPGEHGGYKEVIGRIAGRDVYGRLKFESGAHRVQRVPETETQGRVHTSACTVAVLPELEEADAVEVDKADLRVDTFRASGAGGQHVNKTDSAIRLTHLPTGIVVECQDERSQHKNRARAMSLLHAKLQEREREARQQEESETRRRLVGSGDRSEKIRTYNYPQARVTDHRIKLTLHKLPDIMAGDLDGVIQPLSDEYQADLLASSEG